MENFAPLETITSEGEYSSPLSQRSFANCAAQAERAGRRRILGQPHIQRLVRSSVGYTAG